MTYEAVAGELELYVRIPTPSSTADTEVYIYYGKYYGKPGARTTASSTT